MDGKDIKKDIMGNEYYVEDGKVYVASYRGFEEVSSRNLFWDKEGNICIGNGFGICGRGSFATVHLCSDEEHCFKVFDSPESNNIDSYVLEVMMSEDLPGFYNIVDTFYKKEGDKVYLAGYVMDFLEKADMKTFRMGGVDLLAKDSSYIIESYERLCSSMLTLAKRGIVIDDTAEYNTSIEDDGLVIYDVDSFKRSDEPKDEIYLKNMKSLNGLIVTLISRDMISHHGHEVKVEPFSSYFEDLRSSDSKIDFGEVFKPGEKAVECLTKYIKSSSK